VRSVTWIVVGVVVAIGVLVLWLNPAQDASAERAIRSYFAARNGEVVHIEYSGFREIRAHWYAHGLERVYTVTVLGDGREYRYVLVHGGILLGPLNNRVKIIREVAPQDRS
jgi:hypothetical protein